MKFKLITAPMKEFKAAPLSPLGKLRLGGVFCWVAIVVALQAHHLPLLLFVLFLAPMVVPYLVLHVLSYRVTDGWVFIHRRLWDCPLPRNRLLLATFDPTAFDDRDFPSNTITRWIYYGKFSSRRLGSFQSFVSDPNNTVVLRFSDQTIVVSPKDPQAFIAALNVPSESTQHLLPAHSTGGYFTGYW